MKTTIILCEGPHDTAFLSKILKSNGYSTFGSTISKYPDYLRNFIANRVVLNSVDDLNLSELRTGGKVIPSFALKRAETDHLFLIFSLKGDSTKVVRQEIIRGFDVLFDERIAGEFMNGEELSIVFVYDADNAGILKREEETSKDLKSFLELREFEIHNESYVSVRNVRYGLYVFHDENTDTGRLENMILPLIREDHEDLYKDVCGIIERVTEYNGYTKSVKHPDKASIGMMGQLDKEGAPMAAIIDQSILITKEKILANKQCQRLYKFLIS